MPVPRRTTSALACAAAAVAAALLAAGCGGSNGAHVASLGPGSTTTAANAAAATPPPSSGSSSGSAPRGAFRLAMNVGDAKQGRAFAACMREHGIANFPDPNGQGLIQLDSGSGIDPGSPAFASARSICRKLLPNGGQATPQQQAEMRAAMLEFSKCMRAHGIADFPDPANGGLKLSVNGPNSDLSPDNPQFRTARRACAAKLPGAAGAKLGALAAGAGGK